MELTFKTPSDTEFQLIRSCISEFKLDDRELIPEQFTAAFRDGELVGFGRLRRHVDFTELCSLGVITAQRRRGIGKAVVKELIRRSEEDVYLVCIIPGFFSSLGFKTVESYPAAIANKLRYCTTELVVPETYTAMLLQKNRI